MNNLLKEIIARTVEGKLTPLQAIESAWESGIAEGIARQRLAQINDLHLDCIEDHDSDSD